jgi:hypothetical protein
MVGMVAVSCDRGAPESTPTPAPTPSPDDAPSLAVLDGSFAWGDPRTLELGVWRDGMLVTAAHSGHIDPDRAKAFVAQACTRLEALPVIVPVHHVIDGANLWIYARCPTGERKMVAEGATLAQVIDEQTPQLAPFAREIAQLAAEAHAPWAPDHVSVALAPRSKAPHVTAWPSDIAIPDHETSFDLPATTWAELAPLDKTNVDVGGTYHYVRVVPRYRGQRNDAP